MPTAREKKKESKKKFAYNDISLTPLYKKKSFLKKSLKKIKNKLN